MSSIKERCTNAWEKYATTLYPLDRLPPQYEEAARRAFYQGYDVGMRDTLDVMEAAVEEGTVHGAALVAEMRKANGHGRKIPYR